MEWVTLEVLKQQPESLQGHLGVLVATSWGSMVRKTVNLGCCYAFKSDRDLVVGRRNFLCD